MKKGKKEKIKSEVENEEVIENIETEKKKGRSIKKTVITVIAILFFIVALAFTFYVMRNIYYINSIVNAEKALFTSTNYKLVKSSSSSMVDLKIEIYSLDGKYREQSYFDANQELFPDAQDEEYIAFGDNTVYYLVSTTTKTYTTGKYAENHIDPVLGEYLFSPFYNINVLDLMKYKITKEVYDGKQCIKVENGVGEGVKCDYFKEKDMLLYAEVFEDGSINKQEVEFGVVKPEDVEEFNLEGYALIEDLEAFTKNQRVVNVPITFTKNEDGIVNTIYEDDSYVIKVYNGELTCTLDGYTGKIKDMLENDIIIPNDLIDSLASDYEAKKCTLANYEKVEGLEFYYDDYTVFYIVLNDKETVYYFEPGKKITDYDDLMEDARIIER